MFGRHVAHLRQVIRQALAQLLEELPRFLPTLTLHRDDPRQLLPCAGDIPLLDARLGEKEVSVFELRRFTAGDDTMELVLGAFRVS